jgi:hypothetical protein
MISECPKIANQASVRHKERERQHLHTFRYLCSDFPTGNLQDYETPDFLVVTTTQQKLGIELTQVFKVDGGTKSPQQAIEATKAEITVAERMYSECLNSPPANVSLYFCLQGPLGAKPRREIARRVAQVVQDNMPPEGESVQLDCAIGGLTGLPIAVDAISINRVYPVRSHRWTWPEMGVEETNAIALFEGAIKKKAKKLDDCLQHCDECWLLIVAPSFEPSGMIHPDEHSLSHTYASPFSRTYFLNFGRGSLFKLQSNGPYRTEDGIVTYPGK